MPTVFASLPLAAETSTALILSLAAVTGVGLDRLLGEPRRWHPLVGFGVLASACERTLNTGQQRHLRGLLAWSLLVLPLPALVLWATPPGLPGGINRSFCRSLGRRLRRRFRCSFSRRFCLRLFNNFGWPSLLQVPPTLLLPLVLLWFLFVLVFLPPSLFPCLKESGVSQPIRFADLT